MNRMRSLTFPKLSTSNQQDAMDNTWTARSGSPTFLAPGHSRDPSVASSASPPPTPTFSIRGHNRWPSSSSSIATSPDSPINIAKAPLHDLVEDPEERDDCTRITDVANDPVDYHDETLNTPNESTTHRKEIAGSLNDPSVYHDHVIDEVIPEATDEMVDEQASMMIEPLCICDTPFCEHQQTIVSPTSASYRSGCNSINEEDFATHSSQRRGSGGSSRDDTPSRVSRRWPSISKRWRDRKGSTSVSSPSVRSAPPSRSSSLRQPSIRQSLATFLESRTVPHSPISPETTRPASHQSGWQPSTIPVDVQIPEYEDPIDRQELASTPLLPPVVTDLWPNTTDEEMQSPLQSPSVAYHSGPASLFDTPITSPVLPGLPTPPLSSKPSFSSIGMARSAYSYYPTSEIPPLNVSGETDYWALRIGHANFDVEPEPYIPEICDFQSCNRLLEDWERARVDYMRQAEPIREHYGQTSRTYKLTAEKWSEIDAQWRSNLEKANAEAEANGKTPAQQILSEMPAATANMPSLADPRFQKNDESTVVGRMVRREQVPQVSQAPLNPPKKPAFLRLFTDPASLLRK